MKMNGKEYGRNEIPRKCQIILEKQGLAAKNRIDREIVNSHTFWCLICHHYRVPISSGNHGKPGKSLK